MIKYDDATKEHITEIGHKLLMIQKQNWYESNFNKNWMEL